jgi:hypothetical protein
MNWLWLSLASSCSLATNGFRPPDRRTEKRQMAASIARNAHSPRGYVRIGPRRSLWAIRAVRGCDRISIRLDHLVRRHHEPAVIERHGAPLHELVDTFGAAEEVNLAVLGAGAAHEPRRVMRGRHYLIVVVVSLASRSEHLHVSIDRDRSGPGPRRHAPAPATAAGPLAPHSLPRQAAMRSAANSINSGRCA